MEKYAEFARAISELFENHGGDLYGGEEITQLAHALQCAQVAENARAPAHLIVAALLHDIGHLLHDEFEQAQARNEDKFHEDLGADYLARWFDEKVTEPIRLHVASKRYLVATRPDYAKTLSAASTHTLAIQGGAMTGDEVAQFEQNPFCKDALKVRYWDDMGKDPAMTTQSLTHFLAYADKA